VVVIDHGSTDGTVEIAKRYGRVVKMGDGDSRSDVRNRVVNESKYDWHLCVEPWEAIKSAHQSVIAATNNGAAGHRLIVSHGDVVTKPVRLWHRATGMHFSGQCYESLFPEADAKPLNVMVLSAPDDQSEYQLGLVRLWRANSPLSAEPYYYEAMFHLSRGRYDDFIFNAEHFLFRSTTMTTPVVMTRYYLAWVYTQVKKDARQALSNLVVGLSLKPLMAEFWCLLGDIHYFIQKDFDKAYRFYDAAVLLGRKRNTGDYWPVHVSRYGEYPKRMMESCKAVLASRKIISRA
jgi:tetratricopeptide (TPR) repeat protein